MGIFSKIKKITKTSHFSICKIDDNEIDIDLWDLNQTYKINLEENKVYFDSEHSDEIVNLNFVNSFIDFLEENKEDII